MIIKFMSGDSWVIFGEIDHLEYQEIEQDKNCAVSSDVLIYEPANLPTRGSCIGMSFFTKNMTAPTVIHAYSPIYIMNDNGRTVETI